MTKDEFVKWFYEQKPYFPTPDKCYDKLQSTPTPEDGGLYRWVKAEQKDLVDMGKKHWRDAKTKSPISAGSAFAWARDGRNEVEYLDETPSHTVEEWQSVLKIIMDTHVEYLPKEPIDHEQSELYMYMAKRIANQKSDTVEAEQDELKQLFNDVYQLISGFALDEVWSEWDESVRERVVEYQKKLNQ